MNNPSILRDDFVSSEIVFFVSVESSLTWVESLISCDNSGVKINMVIQVNGKTRDVLDIKKDLKETEINKLIMKSSKANKYLINKKIIKTIFVKNKIINYIVKD